MWHERKNFTERVLQVVRDIPRGEVLTYKEVARCAGNPRAYRAVGTIMSKNFKSNVPCHRVIKSDGNLGGYNRGGTSQKLKKLKQEGLTVYGNKKLRI